MSLSCSCNLSNSNDSSIESSATVLEQLVYGCSPTQTRNNINEVKQKLINYLQSNIDAIMNIRQKCQQPMQSDDALVSEYISCMKFVESLASEAIRCIAYSFDRVIEKLTRRITRDEVNVARSTIRTAFEYFRDIKRQLESNNARMNEINKELGERKQRSAEARKSSQNRINKCAKSLCDSAKIVSTWDSRLDAIEADQKALRASNAKIRSSFAKMNAKLDAMIEDTRRTTAEQKRKNAEFHEFLDGVWQFIAELDEDEEEDESEYACSSESDDGW